MVLSESRGRSSRDRVVAVYFGQGVAGFVLMLAVTWWRRDEPARVLTALGDSAPVLLAILFLFPLVVSFLKFPLTEEIFVSFAMLTFIATIPLLGMILSAWVALAAVIINRSADTAGIGPTRASMDDPIAEHARTFSLFGTYGIPIVAGSLIYEAVGGVVPLAVPSIAAAARVSLCGIVVIATNALVMARVEHAYGYTAKIMVQSTIVDAGIMSLGIPYAFITSFSYCYIGWFGVVACAFTGIVVNAVVRNLALARRSNVDLVGRLSSLTNIGRTISISSQRDDLLRSIYTECARVVDARFFSIALFDEETRELHFALDIADGVERPQTRVPLGTGLDSWVVENRKPLLLGSSRERAADALRTTQSWLGVPMTAHARVIGAISVQSLRRSAFDEEDQILLSAIANQAAVAIENGDFYRDLEGLNVALEHRVAERTIELRETNLRLLAADRTKNEFLAHMSHELRTPLNSVIGFSRILLDRTHGEISPRLYKFVENIHGAGSHLLLLINALLDLAKIEAGRMELEIDRFDLRDALSTVENLVRGMASDASVSIVTTVDDAISDVSMDEARLKQILINLLSNAIRFSPPREFVHLEATLVPGPASPLQCDAVRLQVIDKGSGIPLADQPSIFDEFYQARHSPSRRRGGTGLGLALTKRFVELHHGIISVDSEPGRGSRFTAYLPVRQEPRPAAQWSGVVEQGDPS